MYRVLVLFSCAGVVLCAVEDAIPVETLGESCGYKSCPVALASDGINVHLVPHTHYEMAFQRTFTEHYTGRHDNLTKTDVNFKLTMDHVVSELWTNHYRKFTISDFPYFFHWWSNRDKQVRNLVFNLVRNGRLTFVGGGWGMPDEASTSYHAIIDSFTYTLRKINVTFGECGRPLVGWQADVMGHSREFASLSAQMGYDSLFINPISFDDELSRMQRWALEFLWRGSDDLGPRSDIYTHKLFDGYWSPPGFCFGALCSDPLIVQSSIHFNNIKERSTEFINMVYNRQAPNYNSSHVMVMMGQMLGYFDAPTWFANIDALIDGVHTIVADQNKKKMYLMYSTPYCYAEAVRNEGITLETKQDDFYPFAYDKSSYLVGLYTTSPSIKLLAKETLLYLQMFKQLNVLAEMDNSAEYKTLYEQLNWILGAFHDHTVITGSMGTYIKSYYIKKQYVAVKRSIIYLSNAFNKLRNSPNDTKYYRCALNVSSCFWIRNGKNYFIQMYNPMSWSVTVPVRIPTNCTEGRTWTVYYPYGKPVPSIAIPIPDTVLGIHSRRNVSNCEVVFVAKDLPPIGFRSYFIEALEAEPSPAEKSRGKRSSPPVTNRKLIKIMRKKATKKYLKRQMNPKSDENESLFDDDDYEEYVNDVNGTKPLPLEHVMVLSEGDNDENLSAQSSEFKDLDNETSSVSTTEKIGTAESKKPIIINSRRSDTINNTYKAEKLPVAIFTKDGNKIVEPNEKEKQKVGQNVKENDKQNETENFIADDFDVITTTVEPFHASETVKQTKTADNSKSIEEIKEIKPILLNITRNKASFQSSSTKASNTPVVRPKNLNKKKEGLKKSRLKNIALINKIRTDSAGHEIINEENKKIHHFESLDDDALLNTTRVKSTDLYERPQKYSTVAQNTPFIKTKNVEMQRIQTKLNNTAINDLLTDDDVDDETHRFQPIDDTKENSKEISDENNKIHRFEPVDDKNVSLVYFSSKRKLNNTLATDRNGHDTIKGSKEIKQDAITHQPIKKANHTITKDTNEDLMIKKPRKLQKLLRGKKVLPKPFYLFHTNQTKEQHDKRIKQLKSDRKPAVNAQERMESKRWYSMIGPEGFQNFRTRVIIDNQTAFIDDTGRKVLRFDDLTGESKMEYLSTTEKVVTENSVERFRPDIMTEEDMIEAIKEENDEALNNYVRSRLRSNNKAEMAKPNFMSGRKSLSDVFDNEGILTTEATKMKKVTRKLMTGKNENRRTMDGDFPEEPVPEQEVEFEKTNTESSRKSGSNNEKLSDREEIPTEREEDITHREEQLTNAEENVTNTVEKTKNTEDELKNTEDERHRNVKLKLKDSKPTNNMRNFTNKDRVTTTLRPPVTEFPSNKTLIDYLKNLMRSKLYGLSAKTTDTKAPVGLNDTAGADLSAPVTGIKPPVGSSDTAAVDSAASATKTKAPVSWSDTPTADDDLILINKYIKVVIDQTSLKVAKVMLSNGVQINLDIQFYFYASDDPEVLGSSRKKPGAYLFRAMENKPIPILDFIHTEVRKTAVVQEANLVYSDWASLMVRVYEESPIIELEWLVGPVPDNDKLGKEVFIRYLTNLAHEGVFYTDSNGRQTIKRIRNVKPMYQSMNPDKIAGNLYPVTSKIYIEDPNENIRFSVFVDRAAGGASLADGEVDLMLTRRIFTDDTGMGTTVNETEFGKGVVSRGKHYLYISKIDYKPYRIFEKKFEKELLLPPAIFVSGPDPFGPNNVFAKELWQNYINEMSFLNGKLPVGVHILSLEKWNDGTILLRLENFLESSDTKRNPIKTVFIKNMFTNIEIKSVRETTLAANIWLDEYKKKDWPKKESFVKNFNYFYGRGEQVHFLDKERAWQFEKVDIERGITLAPQEIRTFVCSYVYVEKPKSKK